MKGIIYIDERYYELGDVKYTTDCIYVYDIDTRCIYIALPDLKHNPNLMFSNKLGFYIIKRQVTARQLQTHKWFAKHLYPYQTITRDYGVGNNLVKFTQTSSEYYKDKNLSFNKLGTLVPYTLGLEFETSLGALPENVCYQQGLIPLRDGSITGNEYSTVVLKGSLGMEMIKNQLQELNKYTKFNKECALHIHFGGFPVEPNALLVLNNLCVLFTQCFQRYLPSAAFHTEAYKDNGKSYCKTMSWEESFEDLYKQLTGTTFYGCLYQPHPNDLGHGAKWNIKTRYTMCNLINMICYDSAKTVEFRFLRPTENVHVIYFWIYVLNALLQLAEKWKNLSLTQILDRLMQNDNYPDLQQLLSEVYPSDIVELLLEASNELETIRVIQTMNGDICGASIHLEKDFKLSDKLLDNNTNV